MQPCNRIYYSTVHWQLNMFRAAHRSSSGALTVFTASGLHTHAVTGHSQVWVGLRLDYGRSPHAYVNQRLQTQSSWWWAVCRSKHDELSMNGGIMNSVTRSHLVGYFYWVVLWCTDPWILNLKVCVYVCMYVYVCCLVFILSFNLEEILEEFFYCAETRQAEGFAV